MAPDCDRSAVGVVLQVHCLATSIARRLTPRGDMELHNVALYCYFLNGMLAPSGLQNRASVTIRHGHPLRCIKSDTSEAIDSDQGVRDAPAYG